jgi:ATP-dependent Lon protease
MDKNKDLGLTERIVRELEDLKQSQKAMVQKLAKIEVLNLMMGDELLEKEAPNMQERFAENTLAISVMLEEISGKKDQYGKSDYSLENDNAAVYNFVAG